MIRSALIVVGVLIGTTLNAQEFIAVNGALSDRDFYRLVSCAAPPGKACGRDVVRWPAAKARNLTIAVTRIDPTFPARKARAIDAALTAAAQDITGLNAGVRITRNQRRPDIRVLLMDHPEKSPLTGTGIAGLDGNFIDAAYVHIWWNGAKAITQGVIIMTPHVRDSSITSVMLEELTQSLGLITDIRGPHYRGTSIFDQDGNAVTRLRGQDAMAIRMHYAR